jgi:rod shape-determining protein MreD
VNGRLLQRPVCLTLTLAVPLLQLANPPFLRLDGVSPSWAVLWLLPWALADGRRSGLLMALGLGLLLDALHVAGPSTLPGLLLLGWWYGRIGALARPIQRSFNLGLLAMLGCLLLDLTLLLQFWLPPWRVAADQLRDGGLTTLLTQALLTGLLAPLVCSLLLLAWRRLAPS